MIIAKNAKQKLGSLLISYANGTNDYYRTKLMSGDSLLELVREAREFDDVALLSRLINKEFEEKKVELAQARQALSC